VVLEQDITLFLQRSLDRAGEHAEHAGQEHAQVNIGFGNVDGRVDRLAHRLDLEIELVAGPSRLDLRAARNVLLELMDVVGDPPPRLVLAEVVREIDVDRLRHGCDSGRAFSAFQAATPGYGEPMRKLLAALIFLTVPAAAQVPLPAPAPMGTPAAPPVPYDPAAPYITVGQDEPGYRSWYLAGPWRAAQVKQFNDYLTASRVSGIVPTWELFRTATSWKECGAEPFEIPPTSEWPHIVQTLRYINDYVIPAVGPVEPVSGYRNPSLNRCAGGAPESAHKTYSAVDLVPLRPITREQLMKALCVAHSEHGAAYSTGLGFYAYLRFHIDSTKYRRWNMDPAVAALCPPIIHPDDLANVGQPLPAQPATPAATLPPTSPPQAPPLPSSNPPVSTPKN